MPDSTVMQYPEKEQVEAMRLYEALLTFESLVDVFSVPALQITLRQLDKLLTQSVEPETRAFLNAAITRVQEAIRTS